MCRVFNLNDMSYKKQEKIVKRIIVLIKMSSCSYLVAFVNTKIKSY